MTHAKADSPRLAIREQASVRKIPADGGPVREEAGTVRWLDAATGEALTDPELIERLERRYAITHGGA